MTEKTREALGPAYDRLFDDDRLSLGDYATRDTVKVKVEDEHRDHAEDVFAEEDIEVTVLHTAPGSVTFGFPLP